jgi:hypothetical protein
VHLVGSKCNCNYDSKFIRVSKLICDSKWTRKSKFFRCCNFIIFATNLIPETKWICFIQFIRNRKLTEMKTDLTSKQMAVDSDQ